MCTDVYEHYDVNVLLKYGAIIAGNIDAPAAGESFVDGVVVEKWVKSFGAKEFQALITLCAYTRLQTIIISAKLFREKDLHALLVVQPADRVIHIFKRR